MSTTVIDTPQGISAWVWLSRMHQIALELNTGLKHSGGPILASMYRQGLIDVNLRGTKANKKMVLAAMVEQYAEAMPDWEPSASIKEALAS